MKVPKSVWVLYAVFIAVRIVLALHIPIFNDESTYMRWGQGFLAYPSRWWTWILDGKQPAVAVTFGLSQRLPWDPLISMRIVSILWSSVTFWTVFLILRRFKSAASAGFGPVATGLLLLALCPYLVLFDTLALAESAVTAVFAVSLYLCLSEIDSPAIWKGIAFGITVALGWWFKSTVLLAVPLFVLTLLCTIPVWKKRWDVVCWGLGLGAVTGFLLVTPVLFNPNIDYGKTAVIARTLSVQQIITTPLTHWAAVLISVASWYAGFGGILLIAGFVIAAWKMRRDQTARVFALWAVVPAAMEIVLLTSLSGRLLAFTVVPVVTLTSYWMSSKHLKRFVYQRIHIPGTALIVSVAAAGMILSFSPLAFYNALGPLPAAQGDFGQYVTGWTSGWGISQAVRYLTAESKTRHIIVFIRLDGGNPEDAVISYMQRVKIPVLYVGQLSRVEEIPQVAGWEWFFVSRGTQFAGIQNRLVQKAVYKKPLGDEFVGVYAITH